MAAWFRVDGHNLEMQIWQHGLGWMEICEKLAMPKWCVADEQRWEMQPLQHVWGACAEVEYTVMAAYAWCMCRAGICSHENMVWGEWAEMGDAAMVAWFRVDGHRW